MTVRQRCDAALSAAVASCSDLRTHLTPSRGDLVGACLCALAALFIIVYAACGFSDASGLSSSAAMTCSTALALDDVYGLGYGDSDAGREIGRAHV